jgi:hypothetical protein
LIALVLFFSGCSEKSDRHSSHGVTTEDSDAIVSNVTRRILRNDNGTYGYEIFVDGKKLISQRHSPVLAGNEGFESAEQAGRVADLVINKIKKEMLPTINRFELDSITKPD